MKLHDPILLRTPRPWIFIFLSSCLILGSIGYWCYTIEYKRILTEKTEFLKAIGILKTGKVELWLKERLADAARASYSPYFLETMHSTNIDHGEFYSQLKNHLIIERDAYEYDEILILDAAGEIVTSTSDDPSPPSSVMLAALEKNAASAEPLFTDFYTDLDGQIRIDVASAILDPSGLSKHMLILRSKADAHLFPLIESWPIPGSSGETILLQQENNHVLLLNNPRFLTNAALKIRIPLSSQHMVAVQAIRGKSGIISGIDYRNEDVVAYVQTIAGTPWTLVTKLDKREILSEARSRAVTILVVVVLLILLTAMAVALANRRIQAKRYRNLYETEQRHAKELITFHENEELLRLALKNSPVVVYQHDLALRYTRIFNLNRELTHDEVLGKTDFDLLPPDEAKYITSLKRRVLESKKLVQAEVRTTIHGKTYEYDLILEPLYNPQGVISGITGASMDITERKKSEAALRRRLDYERLLTTISTMAATAEDIAALQQASLEAMGEILDVSRAFIFEYNPVEDTFNNTFEWTAEGVSASREYLQNLPASLCPERMEALIKGQVFNIENSQDVQEEVLRNILQAHKVISCLVVPLFVSGQIFGFLGFDECRSPKRWPQEDIQLLQDMARSLTGAIERSRVKSALKDSNRIFDLFMENSPNSIFFCDESLKSLRLSKNVGDIAARPVKELLGKTVAEIFPGDYGVHALETDRRVMREGKRIELEETLNGRTFHTIKFPIFQDGKPKYLAGFSSDITERKNIEAELRLQSNALAAVANAVVITDRNGSIVWVNHSFTRVTGYKAEEAIGKNPRDLVKSGKHDSPFYKQMWDTITGGNTWVGEMINKRKDGKLYPEDLSITPLKNASGEITHFIAIKQDITEKRLLEDQFRQAQKLEAVGRLAGGIAHDFNNLLTVIMGNSEMVLSRLDASSPLYEEIEEIVQAGERSASLTRQLLAFARQQTIHPQSLDLNETIENLLKMFRRLISEDVNLQWMPTAHVWPVFIDPSQVDQILANLIVNARDAISGLGEIIIKTYNVFLDEAFCLVNTNCRPGDYVILSVSDNGIGMDQDTQENIFEPFFTTKERGKGTGLGLATVYGIVHQNSGAITVKSEPGKGSVFSIYLPRHDKSSHISTTSRLNKEIPKGSESILVVEDEPALLHVISRMLHNLGYCVLKALSPGDAIDHVRNLAEHIDLVLTDVVMPSMNGRELITQLRHHRSEIKCLFMSGYPEAIMDENGLLENGVEFIAKPFTSEQIAVRLRTLLD